MTKKATTSYKMKSKVWLWEGPAAWHFITLPKKQGAEIRDIFGRSGHGFGSLPVTVTIGKTSWKTSIFPEKKSGSYLLPLKAEVRKSEGLSEGDTVTFSIEIHAPRRFLM